VIVLDTNVISELARLAPDLGVLSWLDSLEISAIATTAVTAAELRYGVARLPDGHRKRELMITIRGILTEDFRGRVLAFDEGASVRYADIVAGRQRMGRPIGVADAQIAAICRDLDGILATRNTADFEETGIELIDPWRLGRGARLESGCDT
jgi:toxin FitB